MSKINLVYDPQECTSFTSYYLQPIFKNYFNYIEFDEKIKYDDKNTVFVAKLGNNIKYHGGKIILDSLWEKPLGNTGGDSMILTCQNWFWYNESLWYQARGYDKYIPNRTYNKLALVPIRHQKLHRDRLVEMLTPMLDKLIYSYTDKNIFLPNDGDSTHGEWERYFEPSWYNDTHFSIVAETFVDSKDIFLTEKTFKPIAYYHPFMILGQYRALAYLHELGFETFENLFDESYDDETSLENKLDIIFNNLKNFKEREFDSITLEKLAHNHDHFYNKELVVSKIIKEVIDPILEFLHE